MHRLRCLVVIGALAVAVSVVGAGSAFAAKGGNNDTAKACQHGGWKAFGTFANQGDCINDGAKGSAPFGTAANAACDAIGGTFKLDLADAVWICDYHAGSGIPENPPALQTACDSDGGLLSTIEFEAPEFEATCMRG